LLHYIALNNFCRWYIVVKMNLISPIMLGVELYARFHERILST